MLNMNRDKNSPEAVVQATTESRSEGSNDNSRPLKPHPVKSNLSTPQELGCVQVIDDFYADYRRKVGRFRKYTWDR